MYVLKTIFHIFICVLFITVNACSKNTTDGPVTNGSQTNTPVVTPSLPDTAAFFNVLSIFTQQGATWNCVRFDTLGGAPMLGYSFNNYTANWEKNLIFDTANKQSPNYGTYRDSTMETFTVKGTITIADLKKYYGLTSLSGSGVNYYNGTGALTYIANNFSLVQATDTTRCSILLINNKTRNTTDTEFVFLTKQYFAIMPQLTTVTTYTLPQSAPTQSYTSTDASLLSFSTALSKIKTGGDSFTFQNKSYQGDLKISVSVSSRSPSGITGSSDSSYLLVSSTKGLFKHFAFGSSYSPISRPWRKVNRINLNN